MAVSTAPPQADEGPAPPARLRRFGVAERVAHWVTAGLMLVLFGTAAALYIPDVATAVGRRALVKDIHVWSGLLLPLPVLAGLSARSLRFDLRRLARWDRLDVRWMRSLGRDRSAPPGKFNAGQKLFAAFIGAAGLSMLVTGSIMKWYHPFPLAWRTGATFAHDWLALAMVVAVWGHIGKALADPTALKSMFRGWVPSAWARRARPRWYAEMVAETAAAEAPVPTVDSSRRRLSAGLAVALLLGATAVALLSRASEADGDDPGAVAMRWEEGVDRQDYDGLYDLASVKLRNGSDRPQFVTVLADRLLPWADEKGHVVEVTVASVADRDTTVGDTAVGDTAVDVKLRLRQRDGVEVEQVVSLEREGGRWKVSQYPLDAAASAPAF